MKTVLITGCSSGYGLETALIPSFAISYRIKQIAESMAKETAAERAIEVVR